MSLPLIGRPSGPSQRQPPLVGQKSFWSVFVEPPAWLRGSPASFSNILDHAVGKVKCLNQASNTYPLDLGEVIGGSAKDPSENRMASPGILPSLVDEPEARASLTVEVSGR